MLKRIRALSKRPFREIIYAVAWRLGLRFAATSAAHRAIFTHIYETNAWGDQESRSGPGSTRARGAGLISPLHDLITRYGVTSIVDAPCGDCNWIRELTSRADISYVGVDVVQELIARNDSLYADHRHQFLCGDLTRDSLPQGDLVLCRDALIHFSFADIWSALDNLKKSGTTYLLTTTFIDAVNRDAPTGGPRRLNLQASPFFFPPAIELMVDTPLNGSAPGKRLGLWALESVPTRLSDEGWLTP